MKEDILTAYGIDNPWMDLYINLVTNNAIPKNVKGENHHIFLQSIFGKNKILVRLTTLNHFKAHWLLYKAYKETINYDPKIFQKVCFSLSSFNQVTDSRRKSLAKLSMEELDEYGVLISFARDANSDAMKGDNNPAKRPEVRKLISEKGLGRIWNGDRELQRELMLEYHKTPAGAADRQKLSDDRLGVPLRESHRAAIISAITTPEFRQRASEIALARVANIEWYDATYDKDFRDAVSLRFKGIPKSEEQRNKMSISAIDWITSHPDEHYAKMLKINKNPEKIKKAAESNRGQKRSDETKANLKEAKRVYYETHSAHNKGIKLFYNPNNISENIKCLAEDAPKGWINGDVRSSTKIIGYAIRKTKFGERRYNLHEYVFKDLCCLIAENGSRNRIVQFDTKDSYIKNLTELGFIVYVH
jgi:hypothetical protein